MRMVLRITWLSGLFFGAPLALGVAFGACNGGTRSTSDSGSEQQGPCQDGTIQLLDCTQTGPTGQPLEAFSDEACMGLDVAESRTQVVVDATQAPAIDQPTDGASVPRGVPFTFTWHPTGVAWRAPVRVLPRALTMRDDLTRWTTLIPTAEAHCPPFGGVAYALVFRSGTTQIVRAETANRTYTPTAAAWSHLTAVTGPIALTIEVARFDNNAVTEGPYAQPPRTFTVAP